MEGDSCQGFETTIQTRHQDTTQQSAFRGDIFRPTVWVFQQFPDLITCFREGMLVRLIWIPRRYC